MPSYKHRPRTHIRTLAYSFNNTPNACMYCFPTALTPARTTASHACLPTLRTGAVIIIASSRIPQKIINPPETTNYQPNHHPRIPVCMHSCACDSAPTVPAQYIPIFGSYKRVSCFIVKYGPTSSVLFGAHRVCSLFDLVRIWLCFRPKIFPLASESDDRTRISMCLKINTKIVTHPLCPPLPFAPKYTIYRISLSLSTSLPKSAHRRSQNMPPKQRRPRHPQQN